MTEREIDRNNLQNMLKNSDKGADYYIDIIERCLTLEEVEDKVIKPLLRTGVIPESLVGKDAFYLPIAVLADLNVSRSTIHKHFTGCVSAVKKEKNIPRPANIKDEGGCITYLTEISAKNEKVLREIVSRLNHCSEVGVKVVGRYKKLDMDYDNPNEEVFYRELNNAFPSYIRRATTSYKYYYMLQLTGTQEDIDAALRILDIFKIIPEKV